MNIRIKFLPSRYTPINLDCKIVVELPTAFKPNKNGRAYDSVFLPLEAKGLLRKNASNPYYIYTGGFVTMEKILRYQ